MVSKGWFVDSNTELAGCNAHETYPTNMGFSKYCFMP